jgi:hypothetical protein
VASVGGIDLEIDDASVVGGAVFLITPDDVGPAAWTTEPVDVVDVDGHRVRLIGSRAVFVSLLTGSYGADDVMPQALEIAQRALDLAAAQGRKLLSFRRVDEQHIVWWRDGAQTVLRLVVSRPYLVSTSATASASNLPATSTWNPALRFFRLSQLADDVFEAYRNAFLALEAILDASVPTGAPSGERAWLEFALTRVPSQHSVDLRGYLINAAGPNPVKQFLDEQYHARRCALFHAKSGRGALLPGVTTDRREVSAALEPLIRLVIDLNRKVLKVVFPAGGMTIDGFAMVIRNLEAYRYEIAVLDDPDPAGEHHRDRLGKLAPKALAPSHIGTLDSVGLERGFVAETSVPDLRDMTFNTVASYTREPIPEGVMLAPWSPTGLLSWHVLPCIDPSSAAMMQVLIRWVLDNRTMPRSRFAL